MTLLLVAVVWIKLAAGGWESPPGEDSGTGWPEAGATLYVTGQICQKEEKKIWLQSVTIYYSENVFQQADGLKQGIPFEEKLICEISEGTAGLSMGSRVAVRGTFASFSRATNPGEFDAAVYYRSLGAGGRLQEAELLNRGRKCWPVREAAYKLKVCLRARLNRIFPPEQAGILCALLLGDRTELDGELKDLYKRNGILHILSISSLHITIIGMGVYRMLRKAGVPIVPAAIGGSMLLLFYGMMAGFSISACRAIGMYLVRMGAELVGRSYDLLTALGILAAGMVLKNPYYLQNAGFLLSFSSVLGIGGIYPALTGGKRRQVRPRYYGEARWRLWVRRAGSSLRNALLASVSVTLATLPVQLWNYYEMPVYSVFLNLLVLPLMKPLLGIGILSLLPGLGFAGAADRVILWCYETLCTFFDGLPFRTWNPGRPRIWQVILYYGVLAVVVMWGERRKEKEAGTEERAVRQKPAKGKSFLRRNHGIKYAVLGAAVLIFAVHPAHSDRVLFLDVGQGDCCLVQTASGENYLFDCGSSSRSSVGRYVLLPCLKYYGISRLDAVFVSHSDTDHISGIAELLELAEDNRIGLGQLVLPAIESEARDGQFCGLLSAAGSTRVAYLAAGDSWKRGEAQFTCLHPAKGYSAEDTNAYSLCVYGQFERFSLLLTGDVEGEGETALRKALEERSISDVTILKVAHHGSRGATGEELLNRLNPGLAIISCGRNNRYGHPHAELLERLSRTGCMIFQTSESGAIEVRSTGDGVTIWRYREQGGN